MNFQRILRKLSETDDYGNILRAKGMLPCTDGKWMFFDLVPEEYEIRKVSLILQEEYV